MHRWLQLGAASAGVGAALWGFSAVGPGTGAAAAETSATTSDTTSKSSETGAKSSETGGQSKRSTADESSSAGAQASRDDTAADTESQDDHPADDEAGTDDDAAETDPTEAEQSETRSDSARPAGHWSKVSAVDAPEPAIVDLADQDAHVDADPEPAVAAGVTEKPWATEVEPRVSAHQKAVAAQISAFVGSSEALIASLPIDPQAKDILSEALFLLRRTLLNQAPAVTTMQFTGLPDQSVTGRVAAIDPEGDRIVYRLIRGPESGSVVINPDGTYTYTPGTDFNGVATFVIAADDPGLHVNLLDLFRAPGTRSDVLVNQGAITFHFDYTTGSDAWTAERRLALEKTAEFLARYFLVAAPVTLHYEVAGEDDPGSGTLASAGSDLVSHQPGFHNTIVQQKLLTGVDVNGDEADGFVDWNFGYDWSLTPIVGPQQFDFRSTALHELVHSFGFASSLRAPGTNDRQYWPVFASFVVTGAGRNTFDGYIWDTDFDPNLIGEAGGLYFGGAAAVAAFGRLVPLYTPDPFDLGGSANHLDDDVFTFSYQQLMNSATDTGPVVRVLSPFELGIMADLGYSVVRYPVPL